MEEVGDLARHIEGDRQLRGQSVLMVGGVLGQEVGDGRADGAPADVVLAGQAGGGPAAPSSTSRMCPVPRTRRNISEMCTVSPGRAYVSSSPNFGC
ncbi:hypothetical protein ACWDHW_34380 [Streptomyces melanosporofaciens]|uniref:hypothetical protein n=1 Tax=unclassified Streptomyces TaxID=2593676 RepID=UPI003687EC46